MSISQSYRTLEGDLLDLSELTPNERTYLDFAIERFQSRGSHAAHPPVAGAISHPAPILFEHPMLRAMHDMADRQEIEKGRVTLRPGDDADTDPVG